MLRGGEDLGRESSIRGSAERRVKKNKKESPQETGRSFLLTSSRMGTGTSTWCARREKGGTCAMKEGDSEDKRKGRVGKESAPFTDGDLLKDAKVKKRNGRRVERG